MKLLIIGDIGFALATCLHNFEGRGIVIVNGGDVMEETKSINLEKIKEGMNQFPLYLTEGIPMYYEPIILDSNKEDKEQFKNQLKHKTTFRHQSLSRNSFKQRRHVPTNRGK